MNMAVCPVCQVHVRVEPATHFDTNTLEVHCETCGPFRINMAPLTNRDLSELQRAALSHSIRRQFRPGRALPQVTEEWIARVLKEPRLPDAAEQADLCVLWLGAVTKAPGQYEAIVADKLRAIIGAIGQQGVTFALRHLQSAGLVDWDSASTVQTAQLTFNGWKHYAELVRGRAEGSRKAFMAMKYGDPELDAAFTGCFKPAVAKTGFELFRLDEVPKAGLIDDRMRVALRTSRFVVADLTHANRGAYWEAGFAEGLGRPVIYTCREDIFREESTHFDTNHLLTVPWHPGKLQRAADDLKLVIRATLPEEAVLEDK
jgi:hypothetical protein